MMGEPKKYGLIIPTKKQTSKPVKKLSVFGDDSSDDEEAHKEVNLSLLQEAQKKKQMKQTQIEIQKALEQDPSVYEYDAIYDQMEEKKKAATEKLPEKDRKPKYIQNLLKFAAARKREYERSVERQVQKEREQEQGEFDDKEAFVTEAFRQKMQEQAEEEERIRRQDAIDAANDVTKQKDLSLFYRNLLNRNMSLGGSFAAETTKSDVIGTDDDKNKSESDSLGNNDNKESKDSERAKENVDKEKRRDDSGRRSPRGSEKTSGGNEGRKHGSRRHTKSPDRYRRHHDRRNRRRSNSDSDEDSKRHSSDFHHRDRRRETEGEGDKGRHRESDHSERRLSSHEQDRRHSDHPEPERTSHEDRKSVDRKCNHQGDHNREEKNVRENESKEPQTAEEQTKEMPREETKTKFAKRSTDETVMSAKERYLARKRARDAAMVTAQNNDSDED